MPGSGCLPWCELNPAGVCAPSPVRINALRLRTLAGRYLGAVEWFAWGTDYVGVLANSSAPWAFTFLHENPAERPLTSGDWVRLAACDARWRRGRMVQCVPTIVRHPDTKTLSYLFGGPDSPIVLADGYVSRVTDPDVRNLRIEKAGGGAITTGDHVVISSVRPRYLRLVETPRGPVLWADVEDLASATRLVVELNEVREDLGWRPPRDQINCRDCGIVRGRVSRATDGHPLAGADVRAEGTGFSAATGPDGRFTLTLHGDDCVPAGARRLRCVAQRFKPHEQTATVSAGRAIDVDITLECTQVQGHVVREGSGLPDQPVYLFGPNDAAVLEPPFVITDEDGRFTFDCVPAISCELWTPGAPRVGINVPPAGLQDVVITIGNAASISGRVVDDDTDEPIAGASVVVAGDEARAATTGSDGTFVIQNVTSQMVYLLTTAPGYAPNNVAVTVSQGPVTIRLKRVVQPKASRIAITLRWGAQPPDLDLHLSGPVEGGRRFHMYFADRRNPPVPFVSLDSDDRDAFGPETITVSLDGPFVPGEYRCWVQDYNRRSSFAAAAAEVTFVRDGTTVRRFLATAATGDPEDDIWYVANLKIEADRTYKLTQVQVFMPGAHDTEL